jgi:hypothetical protein
VSGVDELRRLCALLGYLCVCAAALLVIALLGWGIEAVIQQMLRTP